MAMALGSKRKGYSERPTVASDMSASPDSPAESNLFSKGPIAQSSFRSKGDGSMRNMPLVKKRNLAVGKRQEDQVASAPAAEQAPAAAPAAAASAPAAPQDTVYSTLPYQMPTAPVADAATPTAPAPDSSTTNYEQPYHIYDDKAPTGIMGLMGGMNQEGYQPQYMPTAQQAYQNQNVQGSAFGAGYNPYAQQQPSMKFGGPQQNMGGGPYGGINPQQNSWTQPQQPQANSWGNQGASATPGGYGQGQQAQGPNIFGGGINPNANQQSQINYQGGPGPQQGNGTPGNPFAW